VLWGFGVLDGWQGDKVAQSHYRHGCTVATVARRVRSEPSERSERWQGGKVARWHSRRDWRGGTVGTLAGSVGRSGGGLARKRHRCECKPSAFLKTGCGGSGGTQRAVRAR
jgi:hypothetical protein